jgi:adenylylsulfate kinase-like enzyme
MLFAEGRKAYFLGMRSIEEGLDSDVQESFDPRDEWVRRLGELARILTDSGQIFITALTDLDEPEGRELGALNAPNEIVVVRIGLACSGALPAGLTLPEADAEASARAIHRHLIERAVIPNHSI